MDEPATALDSRFSDPGAAAARWEDTRRVLEEAELCWLTTVRADGRPHVTPLVAVWLDHAMYFCTGAAEQKAVNLRQNSHVILTTGCNQWDRGLDVVVEGDAAQITDDEVLKSLASLWARKWDGRWRWDVRGGRFHHRGGRGGGAALVYVVTPTKILTFGKGTFSVTRHRF